MLTTDKAKIDVSLLDEMNHETPLAFIDLKAQQVRIRRQVEARLAAVLDHGKYINGPEIDELERALSDFTGAADVVLCGNGTEALEFAMMGEEIGAGDAVFIPAFTYNATASAVLMTGAHPVFVDVDAMTFNMDPADLSAKVDAVINQGRLRPAMVIPVDLFGLPADYPSINGIAARYDLKILADGAQSFGGRQNGKWVGNIAPMTAISFFPSKSLGCYGDGGAIFSHSPGKAEIWRSIRWHGTDSMHKNSVRVGTNGRMDSMQAAVVLAKLTIFEEELQRRRHIAALYDSFLKDVIAIPERDESTSSGWSLYSIVLNDRDRIRQALTQAGIPTTIYYQQPLHQMEAFEAYAPRDGLPVSEELSRTILALPMHPYLQDDQVHHVCETLIAAL